VTDDEYIKVLETYGDLSITKYNIPRVIFDYPSTTAATLHSDKNDPDSWIHTTYGDENCNALQEMYEALQFDMWIEITQTHT